MQSGGGLPDPERLRIVPVTNAALGIGLDYQPSLAPGVVTPQRRIGGRLPLRQVVDVERSAVNAADVSMEQAPFSEGGEGCQRRLRCSIRDASR